QRPVGCEGVGVQSDGGLVAPGQAAKASVLDSLRDTGKFEFAGQNVEQFLLLLHQLFRLADPRRRWVGPAATLRAQRVTAPVILQGLGELALGSQGEAKVTVRLGGILLEANGLSVLGDGLVLITEGLVARGPILVQPRVARILLDERRVVADGVAV